MVSRYGPRVAFTCKAIVAGEKAFCEGQVLDVSLPGCLIEGVHTFKVGDYVQVRLFLSDQIMPMDVPLAAVRWVDSTRVGVEFIRSSKDDQRRLTSLVERLVPSTGKEAKWKESITLLRTAGD